MTSSLNPINATWTLLHSIDNFELFVKYHVISVAFCMLCPPSVVGYLLAEVDEERYIILHRGCRGKILPLLISSNRHC